MFNKFTAKLNVFIFISKKYTRFVLKWFQFLIRYNNSLWRFILESFRYNKSNDIYLFNYIYMENYLNYIYYTIKLDRSNIFIFLYSKDSA